jgi:hypothetical protein
MNPNLPIPLMINLYGIFVCFSLHNCGTRVCMGRTQSWSVGVAHIRVFIAAVLETEINQKPKMFACRVRNSTYIVWFWKYILQKEISPHIQWHTSAPRHKPMIHTQNSSLLSTMQTGFWGSNTLLTNIQVLMTTSLAAKVILPTNKNIINEHNFWMLYDSLIHYA